MQDRFPVSDSLNGLTATGPLSKPRSLWNKATSWLYRPAPIIEWRGPDEFVPCHPEPLKAEPNILQIVLGARHNLIGGWVADSYRTGIDSFRIARRQVVFVNSPEYIKYVLVTQHANFERKSPQMRRALEALLRINASANGRTICQAPPNSSI